MNKRSEQLWLVLLLVTSAIPRFLGLGYSHFYGDETKTLYLDKTVPALTYLLDQRKGPLQFLITWIVEKVTGGYSELWIRLPFAVAGLLSIFVLYLLVKKLFDSKTAILAASLYSFSGFSLAFSRTAQYQSVLMLFGLLGLLLFVYYSSTGKRLFLILSALAYTFALYSHYDAIFYLFPALFFISKDHVKEVVLFFLLPIVLLVSIFYVPYVAKGYFASNTLGYLNKRLTGSVETLPNSSLYTFGVYNPLVIFLPFLLVGVALALYKFERKYIFVIGWFVLPFILFEFVFKNPGTHILQYFVPMYILSAYGWSQFGKSVYLAAPVLVVQALVGCYVFIPALNSNYPWVSSKVGLIYYPQAQKQYQLFLYGFPYNRGWESAASYLNTQKGARGFYTNDNTVVAKYYVKKLDVTEPASNFYPQYYVYVNNNQELRYPTSEFLSHYSIVQDINTYIKVYKQLTVQ